VLGRPNDPVDILSAWHIIWLIRELAALLRLPFPLSQGNVVFRVIAPTMVNMASDHSTRVSVPDNSALGLFACLPTHQTRIV